MLKAINNELSSKYQLEKMMDLKNGPTQIGTMVTVAAPEVTEVLAAAGFDWLFIDGEHGALGVSEVQSILISAGRDIDCLVRVPGIESVMIQQALDLCAAGIIVPQVNTAAEAARVVDSCRYPPEGSRGTGLARAHGYGSRFDEYISTANQQVSVVIQAEHFQAADNIEEIVQVPGVDCIFIGPYDLSASFNKAGQINDIEVVAAMEKIERVCQANQMPLGIFGVQPESLKKYVQRHYALVAVGVDMLFLGGAAKDCLVRVRDERESQ